MESKQNASLGERAVKRIRKISLIWKTAFVITAILALLTTVLLMCCMRIYRTRTTDFYVDYGRNIAKTAASMIDCNRLSLYHSPNQIDSEYQAMIDTLDKIRIENGVSSIYAIRFNDAKDSVIYIMDSCDTDPYPCGLIEPLDETSYNLPNQLDGEIPAIIYHEKQEWFCIVLTQCYSDSGEFVAFMGVEIPLDSIEKDCLSFYHKCVFVAAIISFLMVLVSIYLMNRMIVSRIDKLAQAASCNISDKKLTDVQSMISQLDIHTGDEIETLAESLKKMEHDTNAYIRELTEATSEKERIGTELNVANRIQSAMLPNTFPAFPQITTFDIFATMTPAKEVGGDFYDFFLIDNDHLAVVMADVSGKGMPAALFMVISKILIRNHALNGTAPAQVFNKVNAQLCESNKADMFVTAWLGVLELSSGKLTFVNAGHTPPMLCHKGGKFEYRKAPAGFVLGGLDFMQYQQQEVLLERGDMLLLYTDGVTEATNAKSELFGEDRLEIVTNRNRDVSPKDLITAVKEDVDRFVGEAPQFDDLTMLAVSYFGSEQESSVETVSRTFAADEKTLPSVLDFLTEILEKHDCPMTTRPSILISAEEVFINIASYAYPNQHGDVTITVSFMNAPSRIAVTFADSGIPYNPLMNAEPDTTLDAENREIGGLGIFLVRTRMDDVTYEFRENQNLLTFIKQF